MKIVYVFQHQSGKIELQRICRECGNNVSDNGKYELYCNKCGHKFIQRPRIINSEEAASILEQEFAKRELDDEKVN